MKLRLIYKCRACGETEVKEWPLPDNTLPCALLANTMQGSHEPTYGPHGFHRCTDDSGPMPIRGITDLIGFREIRENISPHNDNLGQGEFCNALWKDPKGVFCSTAAAEGHAGLRCAYNESSCHVIEDGDERKIIAGGGGFKPVGVCHDFEPADWLRKKMGVDDE